MKKIKQPKNRHFVISFSKGDPYDEEATAFAKKAAKAALESPMFATANIWNEGERVYLDSNNPPCQQAVHAFLYGYWYAKAEAE